MFKLVRHSETVARQITADKSTRNFITSDVTIEVSLAIITNKGNFGEVIAEQNYIYYVLKGNLTLSFTNGETASINIGDSCFVSKNSVYNFSGDCEVIVVNQPAFGT